MPKKGANISLSSYDDIFETDASRAEAKQERIQSISILDLVPFENHPFKVVDDEAMLRTTESIAQYGVLSGVQSIFWKVTATITRVQSPRE